MKTQNFAFIFLALFSSPWAAAQEVLSSLQFVTIHSPHFDVIINAEQQSLGQYYANQLEKIDTYTSSFITEHPAKTVVIINDKWDVTNGYATRVPYPQIMVYPVLPGPQDSLADPGDWSLELLAHEYTHILSFEPAPGVMGYFRSVFGSILAPNILLPTWWKEGVAVQVESMISSGGRLRSPYQDAAIRALVLTNSLRKNEISDINEVNPSWPEGMRAYLFGSVMWSQMTADQGTSVLDKLFQRHGGRVPYFIETPARDYLGMNYSAEYKNALDEVQLRAEKQVEKLKQAAVTPDAPVVIESAEITVAPAISPNGQLMALISRNDSDLRSVRIFKKNPQTKDFLKPIEILRTESESEQSSAAKVYDGPPAGSISRISWFHQLPAIVYDKIDWVNPIERYSDLYLFNLKTRKTDQLSFNLRAREPAVSLDDQKIAFVKLAAHKTSLAVFDINTKKADILVPGEFGQRISFPSFRSNNEIVFTSAIDGGPENLWIYDLTSHKARMLTQNLKKARFVSTMQNGYLLTSAQNGVHNLYSLSNDGKISRPLTNTLTSYFSYSRDPATGDFYATKMTDKGPWIYKIAANQILAKNTNLPVVEPLLGDRYPARDAGPVTQETYPSEDYRVGSTLWPKYWIPFVASSTNGIIVEILTSGYDPLKKHQYAVNASWDTYLNKGSFTGVYQNSVWKIPWFLQSSVTNSYFASASDYQTTTTNEAGIGFPLFDISRNLTVILAAKQSYYERPTITRRGYGPTLGVTYADVSEAGAQISPEQSKSATLTATQYLKNGDDLSHSQYTTSASYYLKLPAHHVLAGKISGMYTPETIPSSLGAATSSLALAQDTVGANFLMRGYLPGHFVGRSMINTNLEYRFPLRDIYRGSGTDPFYIRRLHGALIIDGVTTEGSAFNASTGSYVGTSFSEKFWGFGGELRLETTVGYVLPIQFVVYYYIPQNQNYGGNSSVGLTLQMAQLF